MSTVNKMRVILLADSETERLDLVDMLKNIDYIQLIGDFIAEEEAWQMMERSPADILLVGAGSKANATHSRKKFLPTILKPASS